MKNLITFLILFLTWNASTQIKIDGAFPHATDPNKKYSLYIPSGYDPGSENNMMLAMHPFNTSRWNAKSWRDTLTQFAEMNNLILVCPDGGPDGSIIDPIDLSFTSALLDSMSIWYNIHSKKVYAMGFSFGGLATYIYGLNQIARFGGFMPIGAAINGTNEVNGIIQFAKNKAFFLIHGSQDSPNTRFYPIRSALLSNNAIVNDSLMPGVGHTIDFANRNHILSLAYQWLDSVNCAQIATSINHIESKDSKFSIYPSILNSGQDITIQIKNLDNGYYYVYIHDAFSKLIETKRISVNSDLQLQAYELPALATGTYFITLKKNEIIINTEKIIIQ